MVLDKKLIRSVKKHKSKYIGSIIMIILSCMMFIGFNIASPNIIDSIDDFRNESNMESVNFSTSTVISDRDIKKLEDEFNCDIECRRKLEYKLDDGDSLEIYTPSTKVNIYRLLDGDDLFSENDILLDNNYAKSNKYDIGGNIEINGIEYNVAGYFAEPDQTYIIRTESEIMPNPKTFGIAIISNDDFKKNFKDQGMLTYSAAVSGKTKDLKNRLNDDYILLGWTEKGDNLRINFIDGEMNAFSKVGYIIPVFILVITCIMIAIVMARQIKMEYGIIGTMTALGYRKKEIQNHYMKYSVFQCIAGVVIGLIPGVLFSLIIGGLFLQKYSMIPIKPKINSLWVIPVGILLPFLFIFPASYFTLKKSLNLKPIELMGRSVSSKGNSKKLYRKLNLSKFRFRNKYRLRDAVKNIPRSLFMILGITFSSMLLLFGFTTIDSINNVVKDNYDNVYQYEYQYTFKGLQINDEFDGDKLNSSMFNIENGSKKKENVVIYGIEPDNSTICFEGLKDRDLPFENNVVTNTLAEKLNISEGDEITVINKYSEKEFKITIDKIAKTNVGDYIYIPLKDFNRQNDYSDDAYIQILSTQKLDVDQEVLLSELDKETQRDNFNQLISTIRILVIAIWVVSIVISIIIINIVSTLLIEENRINISLLKVLGYRMKEINTLTLKGNIILVLIGYVISVPAIIKVIDLLFGVLMSKMNVSISASLNMISMAIGMAIIVLAFEIALNISKKKIMSISMNDALKERNE